IRRIRKDHLVGSDTDPGGQPTALLFRIMRNRAHVPSRGKPRIAKQGKAVVISRACQHIRAKPDQRTLRAQRTISRMWVSKKLRRTYRRHDLAPTVSLRGRMG